MKDRERDKDWKIEKRREKAKERERKIDREREDGYLELERKERQREVLKTCNVTSSCYLYLSQGYILGLSIKINLVYIDLSILPNIQHNSDGIVLLTIPFQIICCD